MSGCGKLSFASRPAANAFLRSPGRLADKRKGLRPYLCPRCGAWHLTSQSKAEARQIQRRRRRAA